MLIDRWGPARPWRCKEMQAALQQDGVDGSDFRDVWGPMKKGIEDFCPSLISHMLHVWYIYLHLGDF